MSYAEAQREFKKTLIEIDPVTGATTVGASASQGFRLEARGLRHVTQPGRRTPPAGFLFVRVAFVARDMNRRRLPGCGRLGAARIEYTKSCRREGAGRARRPKHVWFPAGRPRATSEA